MTESQMATLQRLAQEALEPPSLSAVRRPVGRLCFFSRSQKAQSSLEQPSAVGALAANRRAAFPESLWGILVGGRISVETKRDEEQLDYQPNAQCYKGAHGNPPHDADTVKGFRHFCR